MKRLVSILSSSVLILLAFGAPARAQAPEPEEVKSYQDASGDRLILFRGKQAARYDFLANGHPYWSTREFIVGDLEFEGNRYYDVPLNIDAVEQTALVRMSNAWLIIALPPEQVTFLDFGGRHFVGVGPDDGALPAGFYQVLGQGPHQVYKHVSKVLRSSTNNANGDTIGYYDPDYRSDVLRHFAIKTEYYFRDSDGQFSRFKGRNALIRKFPERKREIRRAVAEMRAVLPDAGFDAICEEILKLADQ